MARATKGDEVATTRQAQQAVFAGVGFVLTVTDGPHAGRSITMDASDSRRVLVGTGPACDLRLTDPMMSRRHAALEFGDLRLIVTDLESTNGTFVNDVSISGAFLQGGETLRLGATSLRAELRALTHQAHDADDTPAPGRSAEGDEATPFGRMVGGSARMRAVFSIARRLAASDVPVVVEGETGAGKEITSECIHEASARAAGPFIVFDCASVPRSATQEVLFGDRSGRLGVFELAAGGTLLLDEIGALDLEAQAALLRAIERGEVRRVGASDVVRVDVRTIATTSRDLDKLVEAGKFRDDLFFRLAVGRIELPPLRRRLDDVPPLTAHFFRLATGSPIVPEEFEQRFLDYDWPGNVRELANAVARFVALGPAEPLATRVRQRVGPGARAAADDEVRGDVISQVLADDLAFPQARQRVLDAFERAYVDRVLAAHNGNVLRAAAASGIARRYFQLIRARQR
jgi:DNA-binding NtrC family response regulator